VLFARGPVVYPALLYGPSLSSLHFSSPVVNWLSILARLLTALHYVTSASPLHPPVAAVLTFITVSDPSHRAACSSSTLVAQLSALLLTLPEKQFSCNILCITVTNLDTYSSLFRLLFIGKIAVVNDFLHQANFQFYATNFN